MSNGTSFALTLFAPFRYWTDDAWLGLTPEDIPFVSREISIQQIFALHWSMK
ncbi:MAG TPA: hypothetical protein VK604_25910 [Bryobacteraceae bacterium]|nr:hypothetical protein [Bryobacteraceae bacterium]